MPQEVFDPLTRKQQVKAARQAAGVGVPPIPRARLPALRQSMSQMQQVNAADVAAHRIGPVTYAPKTAQIIHDLAGPLLNSKLARQGQDFDSTEAQLMANQKVSRAHQSITAGRRAKDEAHTMEAAQPTAPAARGGRMDRAGQAAEMERDRLLVRGGRRRTQSEAAGRRGRSPPDTPSGSEAPAGAPRGRPGWGNLGPPLRRASPKGKGKGKATPPPPGKGKGKGKGKGSPTATY